MGLDYPMTDSARTLPLTELLGFSSVAVLFFSDSNMTFLLKLTSLAREKEQFHVGGTEKMVAWWFE